MRMPRTEQSPAADLFDPFVLERFGCSLTEILTPIGDSGVGESVRHNGVYFAIQEARRADDPDLPLGVWKHDLKVSDWDVVETTALTALRTESKDLQLAVWLLEASLHRRGFDGIAPALVILKGLCQTYWENMYPRMEGGDVEFRTNPISWINEKLTVSLRTLPVTQMAAGGQAYGYSDWEKAKRLESVRTQLDPEDLAKQVTMQEFRQALKETASAYLVSVRDAVSDAIDASDDLLACLTPWCGDETPGLGDWLDVLKGIHELCVLELTERRVPEEMEAGDTEDEDLAAGSAGGGGGNPPAGDPLAREEAFRDLTRIADFLLKDDPHSPVPYLIYAACEWGSKSAPDLYRELFLERGGQINVFEIMGLDTRSAND